MLYHLFEWLNSEGINFPGSRLFELYHFPGVAGDIVIIIHHYFLWKETD